jgi:hypothetical protein
MKNYSQDQPYNITALEMGMDWSLREGNTSVTHIPTAIHSCKLIVITLCPSLLTSVFVIFTYLTCQI